MGGMRGSLAEQVRSLREAGGLTQAQLAARAGVSRQMVGAIEAGRHLPRVDAGVALAQALGTTIESLLGPDPTEATEAVDVLGDATAASGPVRVGRVGDRLVCAPPPAGGDSWARADGLLRPGGVELLPGARLGAVVAGCDPAMGLAARLVTERGLEQRSGKRAARAASLLAVSASTRAALDALGGGRVHAAVVHGPDGALPAPPVAVHRWHLASWQVGLAAPLDLPSGWWRDALRGRRRVVQREAGAGSQAAFERALTAGGVARPGGPRARGHLDAANVARTAGMVAVTIEPAARAAGLAFHPLEVHVAQLWVAAEWAAEPAIVALGEELASTVFQRQLAAVGGYDLTGCGQAVAA